MDKLIEEINAFNNTKAWTVANEIYIDSMKSSATFADFVASYGFSVKVIKVSKDGSSALMKLVS